MASQFGPFYATKEWFRIVPKHKFIKGLVSHIDLKATIK